MADRFSLNEAQREALALDHNVTLRAVAGSGKTTVLVERYLRILEEQPALTPAGILAMTFSEAAARQLRAKLREKVRCRKGNPRWREIYHALNDAPISTIHAFCADRLREYAIEAGVDPDFAILDDIDAALLVAEAVRQTCAGARAGTSLYDAILTVSSNLTRMFQPLLENLITRREVLSPIVEELAQASCDQLIERARAEYAEFVNDVLGLINQNGVTERLDELIALADGATGTARRTIETIRTVRADLSRAGSDVETADACFHRLRDVFLTSQGTPRKRGVGAKRDWDDNILYNRYKRLFAAAAEMVHELGLHTGPRFVLGLEQCAAETMHALIDVYHVCLAVYDNAKRMRRALDFTDLQDRCAQMLDDHPDVRRTLACRYSHILVDEFQDTNRLQWRIVRSLAGDDAGRLRPRGLFIVGDDAQSIYGFRNAEVEVFQEARSSICEVHGGREVHSRETFRGAHRVVDAVNELFANDDGYLRLDPFRDHVAGTVEIIPVSAGTEKPSVGEQCEIEARHVAARIRAATRPGPLEILVEREKGGMERARLGDIAILLRRRTHMQTVLDALESAGIPYYTEGGTGFFQQQEVWDVLTALRCIAVPDDEVAVVGYLRSPLAGVSDETLLAVSFEDGETFRDKLGRYAERASADDSMLVHAALNRLDRWRARAGRVPLEDLVRSICDETGLWMALECDPRAPQPEENVNRLIELARSCGANEGRSVRGFLDRMDYLVDRDWPRSEAPLASAPADAVRVMTVHQAKGLEFPVVAVMQSHLAYNFGRGDAVKMHPQKGIGFKCPDPDDGYQRAEPVSCWRVRKACEDDTRAEEMRLLHVACTRARDALILSGYGHEPDPDTWWYAIRARLPAQNDAVTYRSADEIGETPAERGTARFDRAIEMLDEMVCIATGEPPASETIDARSRRTVDGLERVPGARRPVEMSPTGWMVYCECPRRYFYEHLLGTQEPGAHEPSSDPTSLAIWQQDELHADALEFGRIVHRAFELFMADGSVDRAAQLSVSEFQCLLPDVDQSIRTILHEFTESPVGRAVLGGAERRAEQGFVLRLSDMVVQGSMDLLWRDADGLWHVLDYKTCRLQHRTDAGAARRADLGRRYEPQLALYALAARELTNTNKPVTRTLYLTDAPRDPHEYPPFESAEAQTLEIRLAEAAEVIAADPVEIDSFPLAPAIHGTKKGTALCNECGFYQAGICEVTSAPIDTARHSG